MVTLDINHIRQMMQPSFSQVYSSYYDVIYREKEYKKESLQIDALIQKFSPDAKSILNIGCGTGNHDFNLAALGYRVEGVDLSESMLAVAKEKKKTKPSTEVNFSALDIRKKNTDRKYEVVLSLFHVVSYLVNTEELRFAFRNIYDSLEEDGLFIFDFWYAPGILANLPEKRSKEIKEEKFSLERISEPTIDLKAALVDLKITLHIKDNLSKGITSVSEKHLVKYSSLEEMKTLLTDIGFEILGTGSDYELHPFGSEDRYATIVAKK